MAPRKPKPEAGAYKETVKWFREKVSIPKDEWLELDRRARERAFTVAGITKANLLNDTLKAITTALEKGETLEQFKQRVGVKLENAWGETRGWHLEVIFRNNVQAAYAHGREAVMRSPEALASRPYWLFNAILDDRTTKEICLPANGTVLPAEHPWWQSHTPPLHHNCRSIKRALTPAQAERLGVTKRPKKGLAQEGFGGADPLAWQPDLTGLAPELRRRYAAKQVQGAAARKKPKR